MRNFTSPGRCFSLLLLFSPLFSLAIDTHDTRMLSQPAVSADHIAFIYAQDLWVANADGTQPRRLTVSEGVESNPVFSPDGKLIAFSAQYDGNVDVFVIPAEGGVPKRLTWHPGADIVRGFTRDGKSVLFASQRNVFTNRYMKLYTVPVARGPETELAIPNAFYATYSPDGSRMAYTPLGDASREWKHYRGGMSSRIWLFNVRDHAVEEIPKPAGGSNDMSPVWIGNTVYFRSDRDGEYNVYAYDIATKQVRALTKFTDFPVLELSGTDGKLIFEQAGYLHLIDLAAGGAGSEKRLVVGIAADLLELRPRYASGFRNIRSADLSPSGARLVVDFRGDIVTLPAEKGDFRNLTQTTRYHETYPAWSPDGKSIVYFSDASGENALFIQAEDGKGTTRSIPLKGAGWYAYPRWSPDSKKIAFVDNSRSLFILDVANGEVKKIDSDELYGPGVFRDMWADWSPDSRWLAYAKVTGTQYNQIYLYSTAEGKSHPLTDGLSEVEEPRFDPKGRYLYFLASTDAGPVLNWFDQSNEDMQTTSAVYLVTLQKETISPFAKENDEEKPAAVDTAKVGEVRVDWDGIQNRIIDLPIKAADMEQLSVGKNDVLYYVVRNRDGDGGGSLHK